MFIDHVKAAPLNIFIDISTEETYHSIQLARPAYIVNIDRLYRSVILVRLTKL